MARGLFRNLGYAASFLMPWSFRRRYLVRFFGFQIDPTASIGLSWILPKRLIMGSHSRIDHLTLCKGLDIVELGDHSFIGRLNWISGFPSSATNHFQGDVDRRPRLVLGEHAAITNRHIIDCTNEITIGRFTTIAGFRSQFLTHSIDLQLNEQRSHPIRIGDYCFVGTGVIVLGGAILPSKSVLGAGAVLSKKFYEESTLYAGVPAKLIKRMNTSDGYFVRSEGFVY